MGGHALKKVNASRIGLLQYNEVKTDLYKQLSSKFELEFLIDVPNKIDFGDIDVLYKYKSTNSFPNIIDIIKQTFNPIEIVPNGDVCSFSYQIISDDGEIKYFQVDLIKSTNLEMSKFYFSYGDLGGIIGRIAQYIGLKYGSAGLCVCLNSQTIGKFLNLEQNLEFKNNLKKQLKTQLNRDDVDLYLDIIVKAQYSNIVLTSNPHIICEYLGLDYNKWIRGFKSKNDIYEWIIESKFFNPNQFKVLNCAGRQRANKRPMYQDFLQYIFKDELNFIIEKANSNTNSNINLQLETIKYFFKFKELEDMIIQLVDDLVRKLKFNGGKLIQFGIIEKQIPICIKEFKKKIGFDSNSTSDDKFNNWLDLNNSTTIDNILKDFVNEYKKNF
jgi:hypothetical protein